MYIRIDEQYCHYYLLLFMLKNICASTKHWNCKHKMISKSYEDPASRDCITDFQTVHI